jgi:hypothetical protein
MSKGYGRSKTKTGAARHSGKPFGPDEVHVLWIIAIPVICSRKTPEPGVSISRAYKQCPIRLQMLSHLLKEAQRIRQMLIDVARSNDIKALSRLPQILNALAYQGDASVDSNTPNRRIAAMRDQIDFHKSGYRIIPVGKRAHWNALTKDRWRLPPSLMTSDRTDAPQ